MVSASESGLLAEILVEVKGVAAEVSALKVANAQVIADNRHRASQVDDHEARLRVIETVVREAVTQADLEAIEKKRAEIVAAALAEADRKATRKLTVVGLLIAAAAIAANFFTR